MSSPHKLAELLFVSKEKLETLANKPDVERYRFFNVDGRKVQEPNPQLQVIHKRIYQLLSRIEAPDYLHSARAGRSYLTNARVHIGRNSIIKADVKRFYPSVTRKSIYGFFRNLLECSSEVAAILSKLTTVDEHLATGSSASPLLSYYAHKPMFEEINTLVTDSDCKMTVYVDDITISGEFVSKKFLSIIRGIISRHGLKSHKAHYFPVSTPKVVTGVIVQHDKIALPNKRHLKIKQGFDDLNAAQTIEEKLSILPSLTSRLFEAVQIDKGWLPQAQSLVDLRKKLQRDLRTKKALAGR